MDEALLKSSKVTKMLSFAKYEALIKTPLSFKDKSDMARILADLLSSQDKKVPYFGEVYFMKLIGRWVQHNKKPTGVLVELKESSILVFIKCDGSSDVALMDYCARVIGG